MQSLTESESSSAEDEDEIVHSAIAPGLDDSPVEIDAGRWLAPSNCIARFIFFLSYLIQ